MNFFNIPISDAIQIWKNVKSSILTNQSSNNVSQGDLDFSFITPTLLGQIFIFSIFQYSYLL